VSINQSVWVTAGKSRPGVYSHLFSNLVHAVHLGFSTNDNLKHPVVSLPLGPKNLFKRFAINGALFWEGRSLELLCRLGTGRSNLFDLVLRRTDRFSHRFQISLSTNMHEEYLGAIVEEMIVQGGHA